MLLAKCKPDAAGYGASARALMPFPWPSEFGGDLTARVTDVRVGNLVKRVIDDA